MFKINNKSFKNEIVKYDFSTLYTKKQKIPVVNMWIIVEEAGLFKKHFFENVEYVKYLQELEIGKQIEKQGISAYLYFEDDNCDQLNMNIDIEKNFQDCFDNAIVQCKRIDENIIQINLKINAIHLECETTMELPLKK